MKKYISISVWGDKPRYIVGAQRQIQLAAELFPDWKVLVYTDNPEHYRSFSNAEIIQRNTSMNGVFWRFEPLFEDDSNVVIVRDSDGRMTFREALAVNLWLHSRHKFHIFRDHEAHNEFPIIACAFGSKGKISSDVRSAMNRFVEQPFYYTNDQVFLRDFVYPEIKDDVMIHKYNSGWFGATRKCLVNSYSFCGNGYDENDMPLYPPTLSECQSFDPSKLDEKFKFDKGVLV
jgi:hypothetical protein